MSEVKFVKAGGRSLLVFNVSLEDEDLLDEYVALVAGLGC